MKTSSIKLPVLNSLLYLRDSATLDLPAVSEPTGFWWTSSCVAMSCLPDCDGETEITMGPTAEVVGARAPAFDRILITPSRRLILETVLISTILETDVPRTQTRVRIWTNGHFDTDTIVIGLD